MRVHTPGRLASAQPINNIFILLSEKIKIYVKFINQPIPQLIMPARK